MDVLLDIDGRYLHSLLFCRGVIRGETAVNEADAGGDDDDDDEDTGDKDEAKDDR